MPGRLSFTAFPFAGDEHPSVIVIFVVMSVTLLLAAGAALDCARVFDMRQSIGSAVKSASQAAVKALLHPSLSDEDVEAVALSHFEKGIVFARRVGTIETPTISIDRRAKEVTVAASGTVAMTVSRLFGPDDIEVPATATAGGNAVDIGGPLARFVSNHIARRFCRFVIKSSTTAGSASVEISPRLP